MTGWAQLARSRPIVLRALKYAAVVGAALIMVNHGDAMLAGDVSASRLLKMGVTVMVPYLVSTFSSVGAIQEMRRRAGRDR